MTSKSPVGDISVVTLIRTDTTLDHSQKAEKVWSCLVEGLWLFQSWLARVCLRPSCRGACLPNERAEIVRAEDAQFIRIAFHAFRASSTPESMLTSCGNFCSAKVLGTRVPSKIRIVTLMRPIHGNL